MAVTRQQLRSRMRTTVASWFVPAPDSSVARCVARGKSAWTDAVHLLWSIWVFITPLLGGHYDVRWFALTLTSYPLFLWLYAKRVLAPRRIAPRYAMAMVVLCFALMPWYPSGISYFVFGCVMLGTGFRGRILNYLLLILLLNGLFGVYAQWLGYPWQSLVSILPVTVIIGVVVGVESVATEQDIALQLSHEEVRRLAATAERERIGRDLHDLLGHTLSLITLKLELSRKLIDRDPAAARAQIAELENVARHALAEVRSAVTGFRAADLAAELASAKLLLESSVVTLDYDPPPPLPPEIERPLGLVLREAVTNIARHARATRAEIRFAQEGEQLRMRIADDGRGGARSEGNGITGMRERVRALGGTLTFATVPEGTTLELRVPLSPAMFAQPEPALPAGGAP